MAVDTVGIWDEGHAHCLGRSVNLPCVTGTRDVDVMAEVSRSYMGKRCLDHGTVDTLPIPGYGHHLVILGKARSPESYIKKIGTHLSHKVSMNRAGTPEPFFSER